jgi:hypothetical protein
MNRGHIMSMQRIFNNTLHLSFPDGFHVMDNDERQKLNKLVEGPGECLADPENHIIISIGWKELGLFPSLLVSAKDAADNSQKAISKAMEPYGYRFRETFAEDIGGKSAPGFSYEYEAQGIAMHGETCVVKHNKVLYYLHIYMRRELKEEGTKIWKDILATAKWG